MLQMISDIQKMASVPSNDTIVQIVYLKDTFAHRIENHNFYQNNSVFDSLKDYLSAWHKEVNPKDTSEVYKDYFTQRSFTDSLKDSIIEAQYSATVWKNSFYSPSFTYKLIRPQTVIQNTIKPAQLRNKVFIGVFADYESKVSGGFALSLLNKKEKLYQFNYDPFYKAYRLSYSGKISFKI